MKGRPGYGPKNLYLGRQFCLGSALHGAPLHFHGDALNLAWFGTRRLWALTEPADMLWSNLPVFRFLTEELPRRRERVMLCEQGPGDLMYVPQSYTHGVLCLSDCLGVAQELPSLDVMPR